MQLNAKYISIIIIVYAMLYHCWISTRLSVFFISGVDFKLRLWGVKNGGPINQWNEASLCKFFRAAVSAFQFPIQQE